MVLASLFDCRGPAGEGLGRPVGNGEGGTELAHCSAFQTDGIDRTQGLAYSLERLQHVAFPDSKKRDVELLGRILGRDLQHWLKPRLRESRRQVASRR